MKVAVMTIKDSPNYGGILQAYALQHVVRRLEYDCYLIDYMNPEFRKKFSFLGKPKSMSLIYWIYKKLQYPLMQYMKHRMLPFYQRMQLTEYFCDKEALPKLNDDFDIFLVGSDQVWACDLSYYDDSFFLDFAQIDKLKIAYAASFGRTLNMMSDSEKKYIERNIKNLDSISVREESGIEIVNAFYEKDVCMVLDPTLLLSMEEWLTVIDENKRIPKKPYILCYLMQSKKNDREGLRVAKELKRRTGYGIVKVCRGLTSFLWGETLYVPTVSDWVHLYKNASFVISNSFHGTIFAINFKKQFFTLIEGDQNRGRNSRLYDICQTLGLSDRVVNVGSDQIIDYDAMIDYKALYPKLQNLRDHSMNYLKSALAKTGERNDKN